MLEKLAKPKYESAVTIKITVEITMSQRRMPVALRFAGVILIHPLILAC